MMLMHTTVTYTHGCLLLFYLLFCANLALLVVPLVLLAAEIALSSRSCPSCILRSPSISSLTPLQVIRQQQEYHGQLGCLLECLLSHLHLPLGGLEGLGLRFVHLFQHLHHIALQQISSLFFEHLQELSGALHMMRGQ